MKKLILSIAVVALVAFTVASCKSDAKKDAEEVKTEVKKVVEETKHEGEMAMAMYQCPMKCEGDKMYDKEGKCPKCNMDLKKIEKHADDGHKH